VAESVLRSRPLECIAFRGEQGRAQPVIFFHDVGGPSGADHHRYERICGAPNAQYTSTSYTERHNLTMRMQMRRFTRLTNGFSKKFDNHCHALALYFVWYNFVKLHKAHKLTPAMAAGITDKLWSVEDIVAQVEASEPKPGKRAPYKKRLAA
jgi:hypothetical protein